MELREAIAEFTSGRATCILHNAEAVATILNAVADGNLIPADAVFQVREGFRVYALKSNGAFDIVSAPLTEALEIRSADAVRREAVLGVKLVYENWLCGNDRRPFRTVLGELIDTPQPEPRCKVPEGQTPLDDNLQHRLLDVFNEGIAARDNGSPSPYHGHSLEHCLHAAGWVQRDISLALEASKQPKGGGDELAAD